MGVVGWMLLLLPQVMVPVASQKLPGLSVGVILGQTRYISDQDLHLPRRPDDTLDVSVVTLRINQTDPKSVITQVRGVHNAVRFTHFNNANLWLTHILSVTHAQPAFDI